MENIEAEKIGGIVREALGLKEATMISLHLNKSDSILVEAVTEDVDGTKQTYFTGIKPREVDQLVASIAALAPPPPQPPKTYGPWLVRGYVGLLVVQLGLFLWILLR